MFRLKISTLLQLKCLFFRTHIIFNILKQKYKFTKFIGDERNINHLNDFIMRVCKNKIHYPFDANFLEQLKIFGFIEKVTDLFKIETSLHTYFSKFKSVFQNKYKYLVLYWSEKGISTAILKKIIITKFFPLISQIQIASKSLLFVTEFRYRFGSIK